MGQGESECLLCGVKSVKQKGIEKADEYRMTNRSFVQSVAQVRRRLNGNARLLARTRNDAKRGRGGRSPPAHIIRDIGGRVDARMYRMQHGVSAEQAQSQGMLRRVYAGTDAKEEPHTQRATQALGKGLRWV